MKIITLTAILSILALSLLSTATAQIENKTNAEVIKFSQGATIIEGTLPISLETKKPYVLKCLYLVQSEANAWILDLVPALLIPPLATIAIQKGSGYENLVLNFMEGSVEGDVYIPGQNRVIICPIDQDAFARINLPVGNTIVDAYVEFIKFYTYETVDGSSARAPIFAASKIRLATGEIINLSGSR